VLLGLGDDGVSTREARAATPGGASCWPLFAIATLMAAAGFVWLTAGLAGLLLGSGWPAGGLTRSGLVLRHLPANMADPRRAWPADVRANLPGPAGFYAVAAVLLAVIVAVAFAVYRPRRRFPSSGRARWATRGDLRPLVVDDDPAMWPGRIALGRADAGGRQLAAEPRHSVCVLGPTGSGKTVSVVVPTLLDWSGPAVVTSVKVDVLHTTEARREEVGPAYLFDPTRSTGRPSSTWSPLAACSTWTGASQMAGWLTAAAGASSGGNGSHERFWTPLGRKLLAPLLFAAGATGRGMSDVVRWVDTQEDTEVTDLLDELGVVEASNAFIASRKRPGDTLGSVYATVEAVLDCYTDPDVAASADTCDIDPAALLDSDGTLYLVAPTHAQDRLRPLFEALVMSVVREAQNRAQAGRPCDPGLLLMLDEAGNVAPLRDLPSIASTGRGQGVQVVTVWQDLAQLTDRYGRLASTVVNNHRGKLALSGITDLGTLDYLSQLLGEHDVDRFSVTDQASGGTSTSRSQQRERLAPTDALRQLPLGAGVLVYGNLPPARVRFRLKPEATSA